MIYLDFIKFDQILELVKWFLLWMIEWIFRSNHPIRTYLTKPFLAAGGWNLYGRTK